MPTFIEHLTCWQRSKMAHGSAMLKRPDSRTHARWGWRSGSNGVVFLFQLGILVAQAVIVANHFRDLGGLLGQQVGGAVHVQITIAARIAVPVDFSRRVIL